MPIALAFDRFLYTRPFPDFIPFKKLFTGFSLYQKYCIFIKDIFKKKHIRKKLKHS